MDFLAVARNYDIALEEKKPHISALASQLDKALHPLENLGCYVKDLDIGIVEFPSKFEDCDIFLCWKLGATPTATTASPYISGQNKNAELKTAAQGMG